MIKEFACEDLAGMVIDKLLEHVWFQNCYYDLEDDAQEKLLSELRETVAEWIDNEEGEEME